VFAHNSGNATTIINTIADFVTGADVIKLGLAGTTGAAANYAESDLDSEEAFAVGDAVNEAETNLFDGTVKLAFIVNSNAGASGDNTDGFLVADFDGDGAADIAIQLTGLNTLAALDYSDIIA
jgi:hypothetical protein